MAITRIKNSSINNKTPKYNDVLAGLPFRPIIGTATDGGNGTSVSVAFTGNNVANGTITYTALSTPGSLTATGPASPITVTGLTSGTAYTFQVKAGNSLGDSAYSAASNSVTPVQPTAFESIATVTLSSAASDITFTSIPGTYRHLQIRGIARDENTGSLTNQPLAIEFNSDTGANYTIHNLLGNGSTASADGNTGQNYSLIQRATVSSGSSNTNIYGVSITDIHDYASTSKYKTMRAFGGGDMNGSGLVALSSGLWLSTSAITSIKIYRLGYNLSSGTQFALYGIKGA
jgi:hypothetical protein